MPREDREMEAALIADGEKLQQLTGNDHGPFCDACLGSGVEVFGITVYEPGCGYSHDSTDERPCPACGGSGRIEMRHAAPEMVDIDRASESIAGMVADWYGDAPLPNARISADIIARRLRRFVVPANKTADDDIAF